MPRCKNCGEHVTRDFVRVFGTNDGETHACPNCHSKTTLWEPNTST